MSCHVPSCWPRLVEAWGARDAAVAPSAPCARAARLPAIVFEDERYGTPLARLRHAHDPKPGTIQLLRAARNLPAGPEPDPAEKRQAFPGLVPACQWGPGPTDSRSRIPFPARQSNLRCSCEARPPAGRSRSGKDGRFSANKTQDSTQSKLQAFLWLLEFRISNKTAVSIRQLRHSEPAREAGLGTSGAPPKTGPRALPTGDGRTCRGLIETGSHPRPGLD